MRNHGNQQEHAMQNGRLAAPPKRVQIYTEYKIALDVKTRSSKDKKSPPSSLSHQCFICRFSIPRIHKRFRKMVEIPAVDEARSIHPNQTGRNDQIRIKGSEFTDVALSVNIEYGLWSARGRAPFKQTRTLRSALEERLLQPLLRTDATRMQLRLCSVALAALIAALISGKGPRWGSPRVRDEDPGFNQRATARGIAAPRQPYRVCPVLV
ncbi:tRNA dimethylallyltransferase [Clarias magur]|uniref:tRNA dimethylallyltransferase n=1 Tax=Clarias magur TaxID=1594786 RepID=A0A8J4UMS9_CLAMG|nr:tRNA dimethylallyltransferase [Clarias magur]